MQSMRVRRIEFVFRHDGNEVMFGKITSGSKVHFPPLVKFALFNLGSNPLGEGTKGKRWEEKIQLGKFEPKQ